MGNSVTRLRKIELLHLLHYFDLPSYFVFYDSSDPIGVVSDGQLPDG